MNKQLLTGIVVGVIVAGTVGAVAGYKLTNRSAAGSDLNNASAIVTPDESTVAQPGEMATQEPAALATTAAPIATAPSAPAAARKYAVVLSSAPVVETEKVAREECKDVQITRQKPVKDEDRIAGPAIGAVVGGVLGNQVGGGDGKKLATAVGAVAGGYAGNRIQKNVQEKNMETVTEKQCRTVYDDKEKRVGYTVKYRLDGKVHTVRMANDPGVGVQIPMNDPRLAAR